MPNSGQEELCPSGGDMAWQETSGAMAYSMYGVRRSLAGHTCMLILSARSGEVLCSAFSAL